MDFFTLKTSVDIVEDRAAFWCVLQAIGIFTQPLIMGDAYEEKKAFLFRFAVREGALDGHEDSLVALISEHTGFTPENTTVVKASRI